MKRIPLFFAATCALLSHTANADITVALFGKGGFTETNSTFASTQTSTTYNITGTDFLCAFYGDLPAPVTIPDYTNNSYILKLQATFGDTTTTAATTNFQIDLFDTNGNERLYTGNFGNFFPKNTEVSVPLAYLSTTGAFNNSVISLGLLTTGVGNGAINLNIKALNFVAVPEPSTYALCGTGLALLLSSAFRRRYFRG